MNYDLEVKNSNNEQGLSLDDYDMKYYQSVYNIITGKKEIKSKDLFDSHEIKPEDLNQLHRKLKQALSHYTVNASNESVTIYFVDEIKEQFSSFEKFYKSDMSSFKFTEHIAIEYNFSIVPPELKEPQSYQIKLKFSSRAGLLKSNGGRFHPSIRSHIFSILGQQTGKISVKYVDYVVASNVFNIIEEWYKSLEKNIDNCFLTFLKRHTHKISPIFKALASILSTIYLYNNSDILIKDPNELKSLYSGIVLGTGLFYFTVTLAGTIGNYIEYAIDSHQTPSGLFFTKGDKVALADQKKKNRNSMIGTVLWLVPLIILEIVFDNILKLFN